MTRGRHRSAGVSAVAALLLAAAATRPAVAGAPGGADPPPCLVALRVEPESALVGQQVLYAVRILRRDDVRSVSWLEPLAFPGFRAEWLPARLSDEREYRDGARYLVVEERRALFPARPGSLAIPAAALECTLRGPDGAGDTYTALVPGRRLRVDRPPAGGRPEPYAGLVGRVEAQVRVRPRVAELGRSVRVSVRVHGDANLWNLEDPFAGRSPAEEAEVLRRPPDLALEAGDRLLLRHVFRFDLVPRRPGSLRVPAARIPYYDPERSAYAVARTDPVTVQVRPASPGLEGARPGAAGAEPRRAEARDERDRDALLGRGVVIALSTLLGAGALAGGVALARPRHRRLERWREARAVLGEAESAHGDPARSARLSERALREALALRIGDAAALSAEEVSARAAGDPDAERAAALLAALERARFDPAGRLPDAVELRAALTALRPSLVRLRLRPRPR